MTFATTRAIALILLMSPATALAGWHAKSLEKSNGKEKTIEMYYEDGKLRIEQETNVTILELRTGSMIVISGEKKQYMSQSIEDLGKMKEKMLASIPPEMRAKAEAQMKAMNSEMPKPVDSGKKEKVGKWTCELWTWKGEHGEGEACVTKDVGVDSGKFADEIRAFAAKMRTLGPGGGGQLNMFENINGFPIRSHHKMNMGGQERESTMELQSIESLKVPPEKFSPPAGFTKTEMPDPSEMMKHRGQGAPGGPGPGGPGKP